MLPKYLKNAGVEDVKGTIPDVYNEIFELGKKSSVEEANAKNEEIASLLEKSEARVKELEGQISAASAENARVAKIKEIGVKLGVEEKAKELADAGETVENATSILIDAASAQRSGALSSFEATASTAVGDATGDHDEVDINSFSQAVEHVRRRDKCGKAEAIRKAVEEFPKLHQANKTNNTKDGGK